MKITALRKEGGFDLEILLMILTVFQKYVIIEKI